MKKSPVKDLSAWIDYICNCPKTTSRVTWRKQTENDNLVIITENRLIDTWCVECGEEYYHTHSTINECNDCHYSQRANPIGVELYGEM